MENQAKAIKADILLLIIWGVPTILCLLSLVVGIVWLAVIAFAEFFIGSIMALFFIHFKCKPGARFYLQ